MTPSTTPRALALAAAAALAVSAHAQQTRTWNNPAGGNWGVNANWSPATGFPNNSGPNTFSAVVALTGAPYTITLDQPITVTNFTLSSADATLDLTSNNLVVETDLNQSAGLITAAGNTGTLTTNGTLQFTGPAVVRGVTSLQSSGTIIFNSPSSVEICDTGVNHGGSACIWQNTGGIELDRGATFRNGLSSTFTITNGANLFWNNTGARPTFINEGTIRKTAGALTFINGPTLDNTGTLQVDAGTLRADQYAQVTGNTLTAGKWIVTSGASLDLLGASITTNSAEVTLSGTGSTFAALDALQTNAAAGKLTFTAGRNFTTAGAFTNSGSLAVGSATSFTVAPGSVLTNYSAGTQTLAGGTFDLSGQLRFDGADIRTLGSSVTLRGAAADIVDPLSAQSGLRNLRTIAAAGDFAIREGRNFTSAGDITVAPGGNVLIDAGSLFRVAPGSTVTNFAAGVFSDGAFRILGTLQFDNAAITTVNNLLELNGPGATIINQFGQSAFTALNRVDPAGDVRLQSGQNLTIPSLDLRGRVRIAGASTDAPSTLTVNGAFNQNPSGTLELDGGILNINGPATFAGAIAGSGTINGAVVASGPLRPGAAIGTLTVGGQLTIAAQAALNIEIAGLNPGETYDQLAIVPSLLLSGQLTINPSDTILNIILLGPFVPSAGQFFDVVTYTARTGEFAEVTGLNLPGGITLELTYLPDRIRLTAVPAPAGLLVLLGAIPVLRRRGRS